MNATKWSSMLFAVALFCCSLIPMKSHADETPITTEGWFRILEIPVSVEAMDLGFIVYDVVKAAKGGGVSRAYAGAELGIALPQLGILTALSFVSIDNARGIQANAGFAILAGCWVLPTAMLVHGAFGLAHPASELPASKALLPSGDENPQNLPKVEAYSKPQLLGIGPTAVLGSDQKLVPAFALSVGF